VRPGNIRVESQLYELDTGEPHRCPPEHDSHRTIDTPDWLSRLAFEHKACSAPSLASGGPHVVPGVAGQVNGWYADSFHGDVGSSAADRRLWAVVAGSPSLAVSLRTMLVAVARYSRDGSFALLRRHARLVVVMALGSVAGGLLLGVVPDALLVPAWRCCWGSRRSRFGATGGNDRDARDRCDLTPQVVGACVDGRL
jgi:hypothetical protein